MTKPRNLSFRAHRALSLSAILAIFLLVSPSAVSAEELADSTTHALGEVVVTGSRRHSDARHLPLTLNVLDHDALTEKHQPAILSTLSKQIPGLFVTARSMMGYGASTGAAGGISLRGLSGGSGQMMVLIDGHPQYNGIYGHPISDAYQTMMADRVEVLRGAASMLYGSNAMGGVINIVTQGERQDGVETRLHLGAGSYATFQGEACNSVRRGGFTSRAAVQYGRTNNHRPNMGFEQYGAHWNVAQEIGRHYKAFADIDLTHFNASYPGSVKSPLLEADQGITRGVALAGVENRYDRMQGSLSAYSNFGRHKINDGHAPDAAPQSRLFRSRDCLAGLSAYETFRLAAGSHLTAGIDYQHIYGHAYYTSRETGEVLETPNKQSARKHMNEVAAYADYRQEIAEWLTIDAGLRYNHHSVAGSEWIPQGGIVVRPIRDGELKAMAGKGFRNPTMREMYLYPPSNEELRPERIMNYELSWRQRLMGSRLEYGANLFLIDGSNIIQTINRQNVNTGAIRNWGAEAEFAYTFCRHWRLQTNHSWLHMEHPVVAAPQYKGYLGLRYAARKWYANLGAQQICGLYTEVGDNPSQEHFTLLNLTAGYHLNRFISFWLKGDNLLAQRYEINAGYPMPRATVMGGVDIKF